MVEHYISKYSLFNLYYNVMYLYCHVLYFCYLAMCAEYIGVLLVLHRRGRWCRSDLLKSIDWISFVSKSPEFWKLFNFNCDRPSAEGRGCATRNWFHKRGKFIQKPNLIRRPSIHGERWGAKYSLGANWGQKSGVLRPNLWHFHPDLNCH